MKLNTQIKIYYINLYKSKQRRNNMMKKYGNINRINAYNGEYLDKYKNIKLPKYTKSSKKELGCSLSHIKAIFSAYKNGDNEALILEDDIHNTYENKWKKKLDEIIKKKPQDADFISFHCVNKREIIKMIKMRNIFSKWYSERWSAGAYYINRKGMKKIVEKYCQNNIINLNNLNSKYHRADNEVIFGILNGYNYTKPTFIHEAKDSFIHFEHVKREHKPAYKVIKEYFT